MTDFEHPDQEKYEHVQLPVDQWKKVIERAEATNNELYMFILRSWANQQSISAASLSAFRGKVIAEAIDRRDGSSAIGQISKWVRDLTGNPRATCYEWNAIKGEWTVGYYQLASLRLAFGVDRVPSGVSGFA